MAGRLEGQAGHQHQSHNSEPREGVVTGGRGRNGSGPTQGPSSAQRWQPTPFPWINLPTCQQPHIPVEWGSSPSERKLTECPGSFSISSYELSSPPQQQKWQETIFLLPPVDAGGLRGASGAGRGW